jgi:ABC-type branched-subunit amino acid transport system substrate-binding protein
MTRRWALPGWASGYPLVVGIVLGVLATATVPLVSGTRVVSIDGFGARGPDDVGGLGGEAAVSPTGEASSPGDTLTDSAGNPISSGPGLGTNGGPGGPNETTATTGPRSGTAALRATDRGVTADSIKVGVLIGDSSGSAAFGIDTESFNPTAEQAAWQGYMDQLNERGGVLGRRLVPVYAKFDALSDAEKEAACASLTQDHKVFAVFNMGFFSGARVLCVTERNRTPLLKGDPEASDDIFRASRGYLSSTVASYDRQARNLAGEGIALGLVAGKKIGLVAKSTEPFAESFTGAIKAAGHTVAHTTLLAADDATAQSQLPGEVEAMKRKGVQTVFLLTTFYHHSAFAQHAETQLFTPRYVASDIFGSTEDITTQAMPASYGGAIGVTMVRSGEVAAGLPEPEVDKRCRETYEKRTGSTIGSNNDLRYVVMMACDVVARFEGAATAAGPGLTRDRLAASIAQLGVRPTPYTGGGSYRPGKTDAADYVRTKRWEFGCRCYRIESGFRKAAY